MRLAFVLSALIGLGTAGQTGAAVVTYTSEASFLAATGATLHALPSAAGGGTLTSSSISSTDGVITLNTASGLLRSNREAATEVSRLDGPDLAVNGVEDFDVVVQFGADRHALDFFLYGP
jgi:hypothetical protein